MYRHLPWHSCGLSQQALGQVDEPGRAICGRSSVTDVIDDTRRWDPYNQPESRAIRIASILFLAPTFEIELDR
jgi:hypothetical protein